MDTSTNHNERTHLPANCTPPAMDDFPRDLFTNEQRAHGAVVLHAIASVYIFLALALICDKYFVPAVEKICKALNMSNDVAGATFMAAATSAPELFVNVIGTFITEGDIGLGTIVGSAVFNILAVAACCGIGAGMVSSVVPLHWWPLTRDCVAYGITVAILIGIIHDERVEWYEALILVLLYGLYIGIMYYDKKIKKWTTGRGESETSSQYGEEEKTPQPEGLRISELPQQNGNVKVNLDVPVQDVEKENERLCESMNFPYKKGWISKIMWVLILPIQTIFALTIPNCSSPKWKRWFPITFLMCILWIGSLSYMVAWMITIVGDTIRIPDSVMGITFLAAGTSIPEAVSSVIVAKQGHGSMGISNSLGSNTFDILLCLGLPWLIKASFLPTAPGKHYVTINSRGLEYSAISLLSTLLLLYVAFAVNKFKLDAKVGITCLVLYLLFLVLATLIELNVFFTVNLPTCGW